MIDSEKHSLMAAAARVLAIDAVEAAGCGHPGLPMGAADVASVLFSHVLAFDPTAPRWPDRDRFVLSAGHGSALLYGLLHLVGYEDFPLDTLKTFRQLGSPAAGHPEFGHGAGIEATTGPLGQGVAMAVGMALAERMMNARFGNDLVDHRTYVLASDGDLMEGVAQEAIALAGHLRLSRLTLLWDDNGVSIDGPASLAVSGDMLARFESAGWSACRIDGHDPEAIFAALERARTSDRPSLIACRTTIGFGAPTKSGSAAAHGAPLGPKEALGARHAYGWASETPFDIPAEIRDLWRIAGLRSVHARKEWEKRYRALSAEERGEFDRRMRGQLPPGFDEALGGFRKRLAADRTAIATRKASEAVLEVINAFVPETVGGSADLTGSNNTLTRNMTAISPGHFGGRYVHWGVREHAMAAAMNGMVLHGGVIPYSGTFLAFSDYCKPALRLAALMRLRVVHVMTHDSIGLGEDGPTHQPVEQLAGLRAIPNMLVLRPADAVETAECWQIALENRTGPSVLALSRQALPALRTVHEPANLSARGAYELRPAAGEALVSLFATGSEVAVAVAAKELLDAEGIPARVVSVPSFELFERQSAERRREVVGDAPVKVGIEAAVRLGWDRLIGDDGLFVGMTGFGASAPAGVLYRHFGITAAAVADAARKRLDERVG
ncbi:transketolase [Pseudoxanthobacter soli DSM 19599]|uniref:Transketolase n=1 Tax=Pseudoxanthobacter soli DSM 19599 TaxID=1123029 RepID=A0A1M7ZBT8_9HYPH|nr:transketolase [Pseudoxanthobacter soli]SHO62365.1 transketolase [Pseudoxanthobacter soli DSM 19599]